MITLDLRSGHQIFLDDDDWQLLRYTWHVVSTSKSSRTVYAQTHISRTSTEYLHRMVVGATNGDGVLVDHINFNGLDNRKSNLRLATASQSIAHQRSKRTYADTDMPKYKGVFKSGSTGNKKWTARIRVSGGQRISLGCFVTPEEAALEYDKAAKLHHGEFADLNFPIEGMSTNGTYLHS